MNNDFPKLGINTQELIKAVSEAIEATQGMDTTGWGVNWGDIGISSIEYRKEILNIDEPPYCAVVLEEAAPNSQLGQHVYESIKDRFPGVQIECEW